MNIADFIVRCDAHCAKAGVSRVWLSKRLFNDTFRLDQLHAGVSDVGVRRLERAARDLAILEQAVSASAVSPDNLTHPAADGAENADANISRTGASA